MVFLGTVVPALTTAARHQVTFPQLPAGLQVKQYFTPLSSGKRLQLYAMLNH